MEMSRQLCTGSALDRALAAASEAPKSMNIGSTEMLLGLQKHKLPVTEYMMVDWCGIPSTALALSLPTSIMGSSWLAALEAISCVEGRPQAQRLTSSNSLRGRSTVSRHCAHCPQAPSASAMTGRSSAAALSLFASAVMWPM